MSTIAEVQQAFKQLVAGDAPRMAVRNGVAAGLKVLRVAIAAAAPINRRRVKAATKRFIKRTRNMPLEAVAASDGPRLSGRLRRSIGSKIKRGGKQIHGKVGINVGRKKGKSSAPHGHLNVLGTKERIHKSTGKSVGHMPAKPFVSFAATSAGPAATAAARTAVLNTLDHILKKGGVFK